MKILCVEDTEAYVKPLQRMATRFGHELCVALTGERGYELAVAGVDLIFVDINLPDIDGLTLTRRLRANQIMTPVVVVTSDVMNYDEKIALAAGCDVFLPKPFDLAEIQKLFTRYGT